MQSSVAAPASAQPQLCWRPARRGRLARPTRLLAHPAGASAEDRVEQLVQEGASLYSTGAAGEELAEAVAALVASNRCQRPGPESLGAQGTWEVFYAPHIAKLSAALGARFTIQYTLRGKAELISNVRYEHPLLGTGWLSASGAVAAADDATLLLRFDQFWWDLGEGALRPELAAGGGGGGGWLDGVVGALGRAAFLPQFARFPVQYLDAPSGLAVFRFPPLASSIGIRRRSSGGAPPR